MQKLHQHWQARKVCLRNQYISQTALWLLFFWDVSQAATWVLNTFSLWGYAMKVHKRSPSKYVNNKIINFGLCDFVLSSHDNFWITTCHKEWFLLHGFSVQTEIHQRWLSNTNLWCIHGPQMLEAHFIRMTLWLWVNYLNNYWMDFQGTQVSLA